MKLVEALQPGEDEIHPRLCNPWLELGLLFHGLIITVSSPRRSAS